MIAPCENQCDEVFRRQREPKAKRVPVTVRLTAYLAAIFRKGTRCYTVNFDKLARSFACTKRTVENAVACVRKGERFVFKTIRAGRSYAVQVSDRNHSIKGVFLLKKKKEIQINTGARPDFSKNSSGWISKPPPAKILALAAFLARHVLGKAHRAASRTMFRFAHAFNFVAAALHEGFGRDEIADAYSYALRTIDDDLANLPRDIRWEPSSLIRIARRRLNDGQTAAERVRYRRNALRTAPPVAVAPVALPILAPKLTAPTAEENAVFNNSLAALMAQYAPATVAA